MLTPKCTLTFTTASLQLSFIRSCVGGNWQKKKGLCMCVFACVCVWWKRGGGEVFSPFPWLHLQLYRICHFLSLCYCDKICLISTESPGAFTPKCQIATFTIERWEACLKITRSSTKEVYSNPKWPTGRIWNVSVKLTRIQNKKGVVLVIL